MAYRTVTTRFDRTCGQNIKQNAHAHLRARAFTISRNFMRSCNVLLQIAILGCLHVKYIRIQTICPLHQFFINSRIVNQFNHPLIFPVHVVDSATFISVCTAISP